MKILIVEDEPQIASGIERIIKNQHVFPCHTKLCFNGIEAIEIAEKYHPNLIITDIRMHKMNGLDMIEVLKSKDICTQFIILSGYDRFEYLHTAIRYQVLDYLLKPVDKERLIHLAHQVYQSLPENYSHLDARKLPDVDVLQFPFVKADYPVTLKKVIEYLLNNYMLDITLHSVSAEFMLHNSYLSTLINSNTGLTFTYLLNNIRIRKAVELLLYESNLTIDEISYLVGYKNSRRLYNAFQQQLETTPKKFQTKWAK